MKTTKTYGKLYRLAIAGEDISTESVWIRTDRSGPWDVKVRRVNEDGTLGEARWVMRGNLTAIAA